MHNDFLRALVRDEDLNTVLDRRIGVIKSIYDELLDEAREDCRCSLDHLVK